MIIWRALGVATLFAYHTTFAATKLAIVTEDRDLEALLTASLKYPEILSRSDLPPAASEAALAGKPLTFQGADLALISDRAGREVNVRLVSASTGAAIASWMAPPLPADELSRWVALRIDPFLSIAPRDQVSRVSLLGLRFETDSASHRAAERIANLMLSTEFQNAGAVVLERWRLHDLVFEKTLLQDDGPFWTGADLLDGSLREENGVLKATIRIRPASTAEKRIAVEAPTMSELVKKVATLTLDRPSDAGAGKSREPGAFLAECRWMIANGLPREAWQAAEAAIALGATGREPHMLRIKAAAMTAYPDDLRSTHGGDGGFRPALKVPIEEISDSVAAATQTILLAGDYLEKNPPQGRPGWWSLEEPATLGVHTLYTGLRVLRMATDAGWASDNPSATGDLREALQRNIRILKNAPLFTLRSTFYCYLAHYAGYWNSTPAEAVAYYRDILRTDFDGGKGVHWPEAIRSELACTDEPHPPFLAGSAPKNEFPSGVGSQRVLDAPGVPARKAWGDFIDELAASPELISQADALALRWQSTADEKARFALTAQIVDFLDAHKTLLAGPLGKGVFAEFVEPLRDVNQTKDLAASQDKLINIFKHFLDAPEPLPMGFLSKVWVGFSEKKLNATEDEARTLLDALHTRETRPGNMEQSEIANIRSSLLREYPSLRNEESGGNAIVATDLWVAAEHTPPPLQGRIGFHDEATIWHLGALWSLDPSNGRLWRIDPLTGATAIISPANLPKTSHGSQMVAWGDRLAITTETGVQILENDLAEWKTVELPEATYRIGVSANTLWAATGERPQTDTRSISMGSTLHQIQPDLSATLVASSRRRPALIPFDESIAGKPFVILPTPGKGIILGAHGENWTFIDSASGKPPPRLNEYFIGNVRLSSNPGLVVRCKHRGGDRNRLVRIELFTQEGDHVLLSHPELDAKTNPLFPYPPELDEFAAREFCTAWDGRTLSILAWSSAGSPWGASETWIFRISDRGCRAFPLRFEWPDTNNDRAMKALHEARVFRYPHPDPKGLIPTDTGLVLTGRAMSGFWFVPYADLAIGEKITPRNP